MSGIVIVMHTLMSEWLYRQYRMPKQKMMLRWSLAILVGTLSLWGKNTLSLVALGVVLTYVSIVDYLVQKIPNTMVLYLWVIKVIDIVVTKDEWIETSVSFVVFLAVMAMLYRFSKGGLGAGDVKLIAVVAFYLGIEQTCLVLMLACGLIIGYAMIRWIFKKHHWKASVPMAPFVLVGYIIHSAILLGGI